MEEREKSCPSAQQVLADGPDSGLWCVCVCFRRDEMLEKKKKGSATASTFIQDTSLQLMLFLHTLISSQNRIFLLTKHYFDLDLLSNTM